jgi:hypothetical protein
VDILQLSGKLATGAAVTATLAHHPELDQGSRRLDLVGAVGVDHVNTLSWEDSVVVGNVNTVQEFCGGIDDAEAFLGKRYPAAYCSFREEWLKPGFDLMRPQGEYVGSSWDPSDARSDPDDSRAPCLDNPTTGAPTDTVDSAPTVPKSRKWQSKKAQKRSQRKEPVVASEHPPATSTSAPVPDTLAETDSNDSVASGKSQTQQRPQSLRADQMPQDPAAAHADGDLEVFDINNLLPDAPKTSTEDSAAEVRPVERTYTIDGKEYLKVSVILLMLSPANARKATSAHCVLKVLHWRT